MATKKINFELTSGALIEELDGAVSGLKNRGKEVREVMEGKKIEVYTHIITDLAIAGVKLTTRGSKQGLPVAVMTALRDQLSAAGVSSASVKRYAENTNGLLRTMPELLTNVTVQDHDGAFGQVAVALHREGLDTESKIKGKFKAPVDEVLKLAEKFVALDADDRTRFEELVRELDEAKAAEAEAVAQADENADTINDTLAALEEAAA